MPEPVEESQTITFTTDVTEQVKSVEERKRIWIADKADILLNSDNKKDLVIGLIEDFNNILGCVKEIERIVRDSLDKNDKLKFKLALRQILQMFPQKEETPNE
jgi:hypothetical protein